MSDLRYGWNFNCGVLLLIRLLNLIQARYLLDRQINLTWLTGSSLNLDLSERLFEHWGNILSILLFITLYECLIDWVGSFTVAAVVDRFVSCDHKSFERGWIDFRWFRVWKIRFIVAQNTWPHRARVYLRVSVQYVYFSWFIYLRKRRDLRLITRMLLLCLSSLNLRLFLLVICVGCFHLIVRILFVIVYIPFTHFYLRVCSW